MVVCLEQGADLHMAQLMPLPLTVSCFSEIQIGFTILVPAHPGSLRKRAVKRVVCVCVCVCVRACVRMCVCTSVSALWRLVIVWLIVHTTLPALGCTLLHLSALASHHAQVSLHAVFFFSGVHHLERIAQ